MLARAFSPLAKGGFGGVDTGHATHPDEGVVRGGGHGHATHSNEGGVRGGGQGHATHSNEGGRPLEEALTSTRPERKPHKRRMKRADPSLCTDC